MPAKTPDNGISSQCSLELRTKIAKFINVDHKCSLKR